MRLLRLAGDLCVVGELVSVLPQVPTFPERETCKPGDCAARFRLLEDELQRALTREADEVRRLKRRLAIAERERRKAAKRAREAKDVGAFLHGVLLLNGVEIPERLR